MPQNSEDKTAVIESLSAYAERMDVLLELLSERLTTQDARQRATELYRALKEDMRSDHQDLSRRHNRGETTEIANAYLVPALHGAITRLRPATNTDPANSDWFGAVSEAHVDIAHALSQLQRCTDSMQPGV